MADVCVVPALQEFEQQFGGVDEVFLLSFLISVGIAVVLAPLYLMMYQAFVAMLMQVRDPQATQYVPQITTTQALFSPPVADDLPGVMKARYQSYNYTLMIALAFYSLCMMVLVVLYGPTDYPPDAPVDAEWIGEKIGFVLFVILMVLPLLNQLFLPGWYRQISGYLLALAVFGLGISVVIEESTDEIDSFLDNISLFLFIGMALVGFAIQKIRNVAVQISIAVQILFMSTFLYLILMGVLKNCLIATVGPVDESLLEIGVLIALILYFPLLYLVWRVMIYFVHKMVAAYDRGYYSDLQLQTILWLMLITLFFAAMISADQSGDNALDQRSAYTLVVLVLTVLLYLWLNRRVPVWQPARSLLYLRVFASDKYSEYLLEYIAKHWRHLGPINMIGGPDFALFNLDIKEAYYLLFRRKDIHELFIDEPAALEQRLATINRAPSADKQYIINEFFCTDNMWQPTVTELAKQSDHVLLDLRGFNGERKGAEFELRLLADMDLLRHTTIVVDSRTDWNAIQAALDDLPDVVIPDDCVIEIRGTKISADILTYLSR